METKRCFQYGGRFYEYNEDIMIPLYNVLDV
jgi:hypothetical protein